MPPQEDKEHRHFQCSVRRTPAGRLASPVQWKEATLRSFQQRHGYGLYVICFDGEVLYVGESSNVLGKIAKGHSWSAKYGGQHLDVHLFDFGEPPDDVLGVAEDEQNPKEVIRRAIEAEVTYEIRRRTDKWPSEQHEIHFHAELAHSPFVCECRAFVLEKIVPAGATDNETNSRVSS